MDILSISLTAILFVFGLFKSWLSIFFVIPLKDIEIFWILVPIWVNLIFTDFYQEKRGTSLGNAVTNGAIMLWVGIDWIRFIMRNLDEWVLTWPLFFKFSLCSLVIMLGLVIIVQGIRGRKVISRIGRVRQTSYIMLVLSPIVYGVADLSWNYIGVSILFYPLFYGFFALIDRALPNPKTYKISDEMLAAESDISAEATLPPPPAIPADSANPSLYS